jgi:3-oxoadipate enol-lactonase
MAFVAVRDIEVYYEVHGSGPRVVLINGTGADLRQNPLRGKGLLEKNFEVLMYDQRGLGQSSKPDQPYSTAEYADDCAALMDAVGWDRAHVLGISFGGMVAQHVAIRHPDRVDRLVLACTSAGGAGGASFDLLEVNDLPIEERLRVTLPVMDTRNDLSTDPPTLAPMFDLIMPMFISGKPLNADDPNSAVGARRQLEARAAHDAWDGLVNVSCPAYVIGGLYDDQASPANMERLAHRITGAELRMFDGGHLFLVQDPEAWPAIVEFLSRSGS